MNVYNYFQKDELIIRSVKNYKNDLSMLFSHSNSNNKKDRGLPEIQFYHKGKDQENTGTEARKKANSLELVVCILHPPHVDFQSEAQQAAYICLQN